jgi:hypothetical protein
LHFLARMPPKIVEAGRHAGVFVKIYGGAFAPLHAGGGLMSAWLF